MPSFGLEAACFFPKTTKKMGGISAVNADFRANAEVTVRCHVAVDDAGNFVVLVDASAFVEALVEVDFALKIQQMEGQNNSFWVTF